MAMPNESRPMYKAVCANCGKPCEVPFKPSGDRPVYCKDCFRARNDGGGNALKQGRPSAPSAPARPLSQGAARPSDGLAAELRAINAKLDRLIALVENASSRAPRAPKPTGKKVASKKRASSRKK